MRILKLEIINNKAIRAFHMDADGKNIEIAGETGSGKTTAISALWDILSKGKDFLTHGEKKGVVRVSIGDDDAVHYIAERETTPSKSTVKIAKMLGLKALPMDMKDFEAMISKLSVNPHKIATMKPKEQIKTLLAAANSDIDLEALDAQIEGEEQNRLFAGRAAKASKPVEVPEKTEPVSVSELIGQRDVIVEKNLFVKGKLSELYELNEEQVIAGKELDELSDRLTVLKNQVEARRERLCKGNAWAEKQEILPTEEIDEQISASEETNRLAAIYDQALKDLESHNYLQAMHKESDDIVKKLQVQKKDALNAIEWPLEGITIDNGVIIYNGTLLDNLGESEQMLVTAAIALGDIEKHEIKIARMDGIESMSKANYETLRDLFNERGVQVLSTRVSRGDVEDGEIVISEGVYGDGTQD